MLQTIKEYCPSNWDLTKNLNEVAVIYGSREYMDIETEVKRALQNEHVSIKSIIRVQDLYSYGQFLIREQLLLTSGFPLFRYRRFVRISHKPTKDIIRYNLDYRRLHERFSFYKSPPSFVGGLLAIVQVLTKDPNNSIIEPETSSDYFIEYIVKI